MCSISVEANIPITRTSLLHAPSVNYLSGHFQSQKMIEDLFDLSQCSFLDSSFPEDSSLEAVIVTADTIKRWTDSSARATSRRVVTSRGSALPIWAIQATYYVTLTEGYSFLREEGLLSLATCDVVHKSGKSSGC
jgi:hypothetical protein